MIYTVIFLWDVMMDREGHVILEQVRSYVFIRHTDKVSIVMVCFWYLDIHIDISRKRSQD